MPPLSRPTNQHDPCACADTADTDDLARGMHIAKALEQTFAIAVQGAPVAAVHVPRECLGISAFGEVSIGGSPTIRGWPSTIVVSFEKARRLCFACALARFFSISLRRLALAVLRDLKLWDQRVGIDARVPQIERFHRRESAYRLAVRTRHLHIHAAPLLDGKAELRPATAKLATSRFRSHSNRPGSVSSKALMSNTSRRSGAANAPKFNRCASPHNYTLKSVLVERARSAAIRYAAPRQNVNGETSIRP